MSFDMSLARGLDYYTGIIYEAITEASAPPSKSPVPSVPPPTTATSSSSKSRSSSTSPAAGAASAPADGEPDETSVGVGSIAAGGRYDNLVGMFSASAGRKADPVPCVGISFGVERIYSIMEMKRRAKEAKEGTAGKKSGKETEVYVLALGGGLVKERMGFTKMLRDNGIKVGSSRSRSPLSAWTSFDDCTCLRVVGSGKRS
jgi:histidyl-tRNA synthetase